MVGRATQLVLASTLLLSAAACSNPESSRDARSEPAPSYCSESRTPGVEAKTVNGAEQLTLGAAAWSIKYGFDANWIKVDPPVDQVVKLDPVTGAVALAVDSAGGLDFAADGVWILVGDDEGDELVKIDPVTCATLRTIPTTSNWFYLAVGLGSVWVTSGTELLRFDEQTGEQLAAIDAHYSLNDVQVGPDAVWLTALDAGRLLRIDPATNAVVADIVTGVQPHGLLVDETGIWVTHMKGAGSVVLVDPATNQIVTTIEGLGNGIGITSGGGYIWTTTQGVGVTRIDPQTYEQTVAIALSEWNPFITYVDDELWVTSLGGWVYRVPLPPK